MGSINGENLREQMDGWVSREAGVIAAQYLAFVDHAWRATPVDHYLRPDRLNAAVIRGGLVGESGELAEEIKKGIRSRGTSWRPLDLVLEAGDVFFYLSCAALRYGDAALREQVERLIGTWSSGSSPGHDELVRRLGERLLFTHGSDNADLTRSLHLKLLSLSEDIAAAAVQLAISIRYADDVTSVDAASITRAMFKLEDLGALLEINFRDLFVLSAAKVIERESNSGITAADAFARMVESIRSKNPALGGCRMAIGGKPGGRTPSPLEVIDFVTCMRDRAILYRCEQFAGEPVVVDVEDSYGVAFGVAAAAAERIRRGDENCTPIGALQDAVEAALLLNADPSGEPSLPWRRSFGKGYVCPWRVDFSLVPAAVKCAAVAGIGDDLAAIALRQSVSDLRLASARYGTGLNTAEFVALAGLLLLIEQSLSEIPVQDRFMRTRADIERRVGRSLLIDVQRAHVLEMRKLYRMTTFVTKSL